MDTSSGFFTKYVSELARKESMALDIESAIHMNNYTLVDLILEENPEDDLLNFKCDPFGSPRHRRTQIPNTVTGMFFSRWSRKDDIEPDHWQELIKRGGLLSFTCFDICCHRQHNRPLALWMLDNGGYYFHDIDPKYHTVFQIYNHEELERRDSIDNVGSSVFYSDDKQIISRWGKTVVKKVRKFLKKNRKKRKEYWTRVN